MALTYEKLRIESSLTLASILSLSIHQEPNTHASLSFSAHMGKESLRSLYNLGKQEAVRVLDGEHQAVLFSGLITNADLTVHDGYHVVTIQAQSASITLDMEQNSRSFQDASMTYAQVVQSVISTTPGAEVLCSAGEDQPIGFPIIQYKETYWQFLLRLASHLNTSIYADCTRGGVHVFFGMPKAGKTLESLGVLHCTRSVSSLYYEAEGPAKGIPKQEFYAVAVTVEQPARIGDRGVVDQAEYQVTQVHSRMEHSVMRHRITLGKPALLSQPMRYNPHFGGVELQGSVLATDRETVKVHLDIDAGQEAGTAYPFEWTPPTGNLMYLMPKMGTRVSLRICDYEENSAKVVSSPRANGAAHPSMGDPNNRYLTTEHNKIMALTPQSLDFVGGGSAASPLRASLDDATGCVFESPTAVKLYALSNISFEGKNVTLRTPAEIHAAQTSRFSATIAGEIVPKGTR